MREPQRLAFAQKFGREPGAGDPIFFDPDATEPRFWSEAQIQKMQEEICTAMLNTGIDPAYVYAYRKTGRILTTKNKRFLTRAELKPPMQSRRTVVLTASSSSLKKESHGSGVRLDGDMIELLHG
jgi:hypothetical protein